MFTKENAAANGKKGGKMRGPITTAKRLMKELAEAVVTDPDVQNRLVLQAREGTIAPGVLITLFHYYGGKPPTKIEVAPPRSDSADAMRRRLAALTPEERSAYADILRKVIQGERDETLQPALPARRRRDVTPEPATA